MQYHYWIFVPLYKSGAQLVSGFTAVAVKEPLKRINVRI
jgi:hypothetical protein